MKSCLKFSNLLLIFIFLLASYLTAQTYPIIRPQTATNAPNQGTIRVIKIKPNEPIHIVSWFAFSGTNSNLGVNLKRGVELAIDEKGMQLLDHPIRITIQDTGCNEDNGRNAAIKIATDPSVVAAIGPSCSNEAKVGVPILWRAGICTISPSNTAPELTDSTRGNGFSGYLRTSYNDKTQGAVAAQFTSTQLKSRKTATITDGSIYSTILESSFVETFKLLGGIITTRETVKPDQKDLRSILSKIAIQKPETLYFPISMNTSSQIVNQIRNIPGLENIILISSDASFNTKFYQDTSKNALEMYHTSPDFTNYSGFKIADFERKYQEKYGEIPIYIFHANSYDAAMMIFTAIEKVTKKEPDGTLYIDRNALRDALYATRDFEGLTGKLTCDAWGDCGYPIISIFKTNEESINNLELPKTPDWTPFKE